MGVRRVTLGWSIACGLVFVLACGGKAESERRGNGDGSNTGGMGGTGGSAGTVTMGGSSTAGSNAAGGNAARGNGGASGTAGDRGGGGSAGDGAGGSSAAGEGGATGGSSAGGEGGGGNCVDVCALHGAACCIPNVECVSAETSCTVEVLAEKVITFTDYATFEQTVAALPQDLLLSFTDSDIAWAAAEPAPAARIELHMTPELAQLHAGALEGANNSPFRISCNGRALFVGLVYEMHGAAAFDLPVLHVALDEEEPLILRLGARQPAWIGLGGSVSTESRERIDRPELRAALCLRGALRELEPLADR